MTESLPPIETPAAGGNLGQTVFKNATFVTLGNIALKAVSFLFMVYVVNQLGSETFGKYSTVINFTGLFSIFAELGMTQYAMREIARDRSRAQGLLWNLVAIRVILAVFATGYITAGAVIVGYSPELIFGIFLHTTGYLISAIAVPLEAVLTGNERLDYVSANRVLGQLIIVSLGVVFLYNGFGFVWLILANLLSIIPQIFVSVVAIRRHHLLEFKTNLNVRTWPLLIRSGLTFGMISLALTIAFGIDTVMLSMFVPFEEVGWYSVAYNLVRSLMIFFGGFSVAIVPSLSRTYMTDVVRVQRWYHRSVKAILLISMPIAVGGMLTAHSIIDFLYAPEYLPAALALRIIIWDVPLLMYNSFSGNMTTVVGEEKAAARVYWINAVANIGLNLAFIPLFGMIAAAVVTVITDLIGSVQFHLLLGRKLKLPPLSSVIIRVTLASGLMGLGVWLFSQFHLHLFVTVGVGAAIYILAVLALRLIDTEEWQLIQRLLRRARRRTSVNEVL